LRVAITSLGCKVNQCDAGELACQLRQAGFEVVSFEADADLYLVNTCSVTQKSDYQCRQMIRRAAAKQGAAGVVVTGCYAQRAPEELVCLPGVKLVVGNRDKDRLPELLGAMWGKNNEEGINGGRVQGVTASPVRENFPRRSRAFVKIQDGCNASCAYCVVPSVRGPSSSVPVEKIKESLRRAGQSGYQEAVLTGIHLGAYGADLAPPLNLADLLDWAEKERPVARLRLSSLEPTEIPSHINRYLGPSGILCPHFHLPLQSGDDGVLSAMRRPYDREFLRLTLKRLFQLRPDLAVGADILVGFPGETDEAFRHSLELIEEFPLAYLHVFPFSRRPGTPAADMKEQVDDQTIRQRAGMMRKLGEEKKRLYREQFVGKQLSVLLLGQSDQKGNLGGLSANYLKVMVTSVGKEDANRIVTVDVKESRNGILWGRRVDE
jgi:threonylcarbamoyladenosine tRNA methylthiotransferase MtaB